MLLSAKDAAAFLGVKESTLAILRSKGTGVPFIRKGASIFYKQVDLERHQIIKTQARQYGNATRQSYQIRAIKNGEIYGIYNRRGVSLEHAVRILAQYPSLEGCSFELVQPPKVQPNQIERFRKEIEKVKPAMKEAIRKTIEGPTAAAKQSGSNQFNKIINKAITKAFS